jgi:hypothetical protein
VLPAPIRFHRVINGCPKDVVALRTFKGPQIGMSRTRFDAGQHHAVVAFGATGPFDWQEGWFGMGMRLGHAMLPCIGREHAALSVTDGMPKDGAVMNRAYTSSIPGVCSQIHVTGLGCSTR